MMFHAGDDLAIGDCALIIFSANYSYDVWESLSYELNRMYCAVWGRDWQMCNSKGSPASDKKCIYYESIGRGGNGVAMLVLMPSFDGGRRRDGRV